MQTQWHRSRFYRRSHLPVKTILFFMVFIPMMFVTSCDDQRSQTVTWTEFEPVYMSQEEFVESARLVQARNLEDPGKIYIYNDFLLINEVNEGVHIINNENPVSPQFIGFINIPANKDVAIRGDRLYADSANDLLVFNIADIQNPELISRKDGVFKMVNNSTSQLPYRPADPSKGVVVDWKPVKVEEVCHGECHRMGSGFMDRGGIQFLTSGGARAESSFDGSSTTTGTGGSMARFTIKEDYLFVVDWSDLLTFDISSPEPVKLNQQSIGWRIETIFPYGDNLFIGSGNSMYIYDISNPVSPELISRFQHATACDPIVVENDYAYVTLRDGNICPNVAGDNLLEVIDVKDLQNPKRIGMYEMIHPHGLGIDDGDLFISEGMHGLKIMDATDAHNLKEIRHIKGILTYDVIPNNGVLIVTGAGGIIQYDYSNIENLKELSTIPVYEPHL